ncbi:hypothetical protein K431DRAFT_290270 [Polychaeton citri CBS 116435]|uniref:C2H2-type domain-containing protein n=1 Tax=Polychaeton citri CBS 116435 TaxID=1314669 RepID=A0A9P4UUG0_9PEZI|nr:hypothetical protein K431DRAFT_290270 [Polychaeton citri CBS 116435]
MSGVNVLACENLQWDQFMFREYDTHYIVLIGINTRMRIQFQQLKGFGCLSYVQHYFSIAPLFIACFAPNASTIARRHHDSRHQGKPQIQLPCSRTSFGLAKDFANFVLFSSSPVRYCPDISNYSSSMSDRPGAYGANKASDTSFRKTWDRSEYDQKARDREAAIREEGKLKHEAALQGKKYIRRASTPEDARDTEARRARLNVAEQVGKTQLVPVGAGQGKRGKSAGFYCDVCDLTFKDNLQFVEHLNSKQHLVASGESGEVRRATLEEVIDRFEYLKRKKEEEAAKETVDLSTRIENAREVDEREREEKRRKRNEKRRKTKDGTGMVEVKVENDGNIF